MTRPPIPPHDPLTLDELITLALAGTVGEPLYAAYDRTVRTLQDAKGQITDVRANAVFDVLKGTLMFAYPLTADQRSILEGLHHPN